MLGSNLGARACRQFRVCAHAAFQRPLQGRPYHDLGLKSIVPFLAPSDGVPFACFLTLHHASEASSEERPVAPATEQQDVMELVYVLDGNGQVSAWPGARDASPMQLCPDGNAMEVCSYSRRPGTLCKCMLATAWR